MTAFMDRHLMRVPYRTDADPDDPTAVGTFSSTIPATAFNGAQIVAVDWSERGTVWVTFLLPGRGHV